ncbi:MAG TPA: DUF2127 domain-containing protein [Candidatus Paceibacterota bacterium]|nr:DUF2127 domain-containing protein [Candidatus Paceibacterota bacterium]
MRYLKETYWHQLFEAGVFFKGLNSIWETVTGIFLLTALHNWFTHTSIYISTQEFLGSRDTAPFIFAQQHLMHVPPSSRVFVGAYLLFHGLMNAFLSYNLYRDRLWAYPVSMAFTSLFFIYQIYRLMHTHSPVLLFITIVDVFFIVLTYHEYRRQLRKQSHKTL